jgi:hypothetical protein
MLDPAQNIVDLPDQTIEYRDGVLARIGAPAATGMHMQLTLNTPPVYPPSAYSMPATTAPSTSHLSYYTASAMPQALSWVRDWKKCLEQAYCAMEPGALVEFQNIHFPRRSESDPEQHSRYLVSGARKLGIDLRADENLKRWLNQAGFINYKEESFAWCTSYSGGDETRRIIFTVSSAPSSRCSIIASSGTLYTDSSSQTSPWSLSV